MIRLLVKKTIKDYENVNDKKVREKYGVLGGVLGIICNIILFVIKLVIGILMMNLAIISDAFNNFSDMGSSLVSIISAKLSNKKPDHEHPFGHGRFEYIASLAVSFLILFVGIELGISSFKKLFVKDYTMTFSWVLIGILSISILIKVWMFSYNHYLGKKINSSILKAAAMDSLSDSIVSLAIVLSTIAGYYLCPNFPLEGVLGIIVAILVIINGGKLAWETTGTLLGGKPDKETVDAIRNILVDESLVLGVHDLIVHDYGPGRKMASVHVEIDEDDNVVVAHEMIDALEKKVENELDIPLVIHMDPISTKCEEVKLLKKVIREFIATIDERLSIHDLRITKGEINSNVIFDLVVPFDLIEKEEKIIEQITQEVAKIDEKYSCVVNIDHE